MTKLTVEPKSILRTGGAVYADTSLANFTLKNDAKHESFAEIILDYHECEGGIPIFEVEHAVGNVGLQVRIVYSETLKGIDHETGDGPFFLFSNAMDSYRSRLMNIDLSATPRTYRAQDAQRSQRYQKITLITPQSTIVFTKVGFERVRPQVIAKSSFSCSDERLNHIWRDGVKTVDMCTVAENETAPSWDVDEEGSCIRGQHWAPCRYGTRWANKIVDFEARIESGGISWAVHMVANGLIFCLDGEQKELIASEGIAHETTIFPSKEKGRWSIPYLAYDKWMRIKTIAEGTMVQVVVNDVQVALIHGLDIHPLLGGSSNNTGSIAFGGPTEWTARYRNLVVRDENDKILYANNMRLQDQARTLADFQVGTNALACTIDGAKRDRACFGGDLHVLGRSIAYSSMTFEAIAGSIELLTSHQTKAGYLGNLCPIQAPVHNLEDEPPTYAFYSITYGCLLVVAIKDYWLQTADERIRLMCYDKVKKHLDFTEAFVDGRGIVSAPPPLSMHWFPMGGPVFGPSLALNVAYYDALQAFSLLSSDEAERRRYVIRATALKIAIQDSFFNASSPISCLGSSLPASGICQDAIAYALTKDLLEPHDSIISQITDPEAKLPRAFRGLNHWDKANIVSPYATGFAVEALLSKGQGQQAKNLLERVWGVMADRSSPNYSGGHWEALRSDGTPHGHDTSLMHGWSTWPVFLLPRYLAGLYPIEAGWKVFGIAPVLTGLARISCRLCTVSGSIEVELDIDEKVGHGSVRLRAAYGLRARLEAPAGWTALGPKELEMTGTWNKFFFTKEHASTRQ